MPAKRLRRKFNPWKASRLLAVPLFLFLIISVVTGGGRAHSGERRADTTRQDARRAQMDSLGELQEEEIVFDDDRPNPAAACLEEMPPGTVKMRVNYFGSYARYFNDSNYVHQAAAERIGIEPLTGLRSHWQTRRPLVKVKSCRDYFIDSLEFSRPFLVPQAAVRLAEIGRRFRDSVDARGGGDYRVKVTSLLRTPRSVARLRRRNRNAIDSSVHRYGTTFDISYAQFVADNDRLPRSASDLEGVLAEVLKAMREEGKIYVKYERHQPCFHITARR